MMQRSIESIIVGDRFREGTGGDLRMWSLTESIREHGLLHPIVITTDNVLIAGYRRLEACRELGWPGIPVTVIDPDDIRRAEFDENYVRLDFTPSEGAAAARYLQPKEIAEAKERQGGPGRNRSGKLPEQCTGQTRDKVAAYVGMSGRTLEKAAAVVEAAEQDPEKFGPVVEEMDRTGKVDPAYRKVRPRDPLDSTVDIDEKTITVESETLFLLKTNWRKATKKDRKSFRAWIRTVNSRKGKRKRGSYDDWRELVEITDAIEQQAKQMRLLCVDVPHKIPARQLCEALSDRFKELAQKLVKGGRT